MNGSKPNPHEPPDASRPVGFEFAHTVARSRRHGTWWPEGVTSRSVIWRVVRHEADGRLRWMRIRIEQMRDGRSETLWLNPRVDVLSAGSDPGGTDREPTG